MTYIVEVDVGDRIDRINDKAMEIFTIHDLNYIWGDVKKKPPDFDLHLGIYLLESETLPAYLLDQIKKWARENKKADINYFKTFMVAK